MIVVPWSVGLHTCHVRPWPDVRVYLSTRETHQSLDGIAVRELRKKAKRSSVSAGLD